LNDLTDRARVAVAVGRAQRIENLVALQDADATKREYILTYDGYSNGSHWGRLANGGRMRVTPISPGAIERGEVFVGVGGAGGAILANWMP